MPLRAELPSAADHRDALRDVPPRHERHRQRRSWAGAGRTAVQCSRCLSERPLLAQQRPGEFGIPDDLHHVGQPGNDPAGLDKSAPRECSAPASSTARRSAYSFPPSRTPWCAKRRASLPPRWRRGSARRPGWPRTASVAPALPPLGRPAAASACAAAVSSPTATAIRACSGCSRPKSRASLESLGGPSRQEAHQRSRRPQCYLRLGICKGKPTRSRWDWCKPRWGLLDIHAEHCRSYCNCTTLSADRTFAVSPLPGLS